MFFNGSLVLSSISLSLVAITLSPNQVMGSTYQLTDLRFNIAQATNPATSSSNQQESDVGVDQWLLRERIVFLTGEITSESAESIISQLIYLDKKAPGTDIYLYINSEGGGIAPGLAIYDTIQSLQSDVVTASLGQSSSMASILLASGTQGKRVALPNSRIMIHQPTSFVVGQASEIEIEAKEILYSKNLLNSLLAELTGQSLRQIEIDTDRDFFMSAQEAKVYGIIDKVVNQLPSASHPLSK
jgi:ATP-dependent Clp protease protease subunit